MISFAHLSIGAKLTLTSAVGGALIVALMFNQWSGNQTISSAMTQLANEQMLLDSIGTAEDSVSRMEIAIRNARLQASPDDVDTAGAAIDAQLAEASAALEKAMPITSDPAELKGIQEAFTAYSDSAHGMISLITDNMAMGQDFAAEEQFKQEHIDPAQTNVATLIDAAQAKSVARTTEAQERVSGAISSVGLWSNILGIIALLAMIGSAIFSLRGVAKPIRSMTDSMNKLSAGDIEADIPFQDRKDEVGKMAATVQIFKDGLIRAASLEAEKEATTRRASAGAMAMAELQGKISEVVTAGVAGDLTKRIDAQFDDGELTSLAEGVNRLMDTMDRGVTETGTVLAAMAQTDLTHRVTGAYQGAFARLKNDTNAVADKLSEIVGQLKETSRGLKTATGEILSGANDLSERTTKQAATIEETSAAMEQLAATVLQNADRAKEASSVSGNVTRTAEEGGKVMGEATTAMERITQSSAKISNIIGLIDDIAFQTNLLALNASVEAARAGDAGKGFAVVAVEVRRLAQSAASASSEVKVLIDQSSGEVKTGSKLVADAASRLQSMLEAARSSNELMDGIARESREQASSIEEVNTAIRQLDEMTQHNAALVEETNAAIEQTEAQANDLDRIVDVFTLEEAPVQQGRRRLAA
jgi:methyl-accepting chemotaxis protein